MPVQGDIRAQRLLVEEISRPLPSVWQIRQSRKGCALLLRVQYQLTAANGKPRRLSHINFFPKAEILVNLQPLPPRIIEQEEVVIEEEEGVSVNTTTSCKLLLKRVVNIQRFNSIEGWDDFFLSEPDSICRNLRRHADNSDSWAVTAGSQV